MQTKKHVSGVLSHVGGDSCKTPDRICHLLRRLEIGVSRGEIVLTTPKFRAHTCTSLSDRSLISHPDLIRMLIWICHCCKHVYFTM